MKTYADMKVVRHPFSFLELVAATGILAIIMTFTLSLISTTKTTHLRAQQQTHAITILENVIEELQSLQTVDLGTVRACVAREFELAEIGRKHELEAVVVEEDDGVIIIIRNNTRERLLASVRLAYEDE